VRFQAGNLNVNFTANITSGQAPLIVQFSDISSGNPNGWAWDFGDGGVSSDKNPEHIYLNPGVYSVGLTVSRFYNTPGMSFSESTGLSKPGYILVTGVPAIIQESNPVPISVSGEDFTFHLIEKSNDDTPRFLGKYKQSRLSISSRFLREI
jgi:PKD repeat protein